MKLQSGHVVTDISEEEQAQQLRDFRAQQIEMIRLQPDRWFFTKTFQKYGDKFYNFKLKATDVFIVAYPKCGMTWAQEIVWTMRNNINLNNPAASSPTLVRCPFVDGDLIMDNPYLYANKGNFQSNQLAAEFHDMSPKRSILEGFNIQKAEHHEDPRTLKLHLPLSLAPKAMLETCKVIYVARNPKDACVSCFHHCRLVKAHDYVGTLDQFVEHFINDTLPYSPFWAHVKEAWNVKSHPNMHFIFYEDMKADPKKEIQRINEFLGTNLSEEQIDKIVEYTSFKVMKEREKHMDTENDGSENFLYNSEVLLKDGGFFRKGQIGDFKNKLTKAQEDKIDQWSEDNMRGTGLSFKYS